MDECMMTNTRLSKADFEAMMQKFYADMTSHEKRRDLEARQKMFKAEQKKYEQPNMMAS